MILAGQYQILLGNLHMYWLQMTGMIMPGHGGMDFYIILKYGGGAMLKYIINA